MTTVPTGHGLHPFRPPLPDLPDAEVTLRCVKCKGWRRRVKAKDRAQAWARHLRSHLHNRKPRTGLRLLQDADGKWRL